MRSDLPNGTEKDLPTLVEHNDLVEDVVDCLRGLIDCDGMTGAGQIRRDSQRLGEFQGTGRIEASGTVIPSSDWRS